MFGFVDRNQCPCCGSDKIYCLLSVAFSDPRVRSFVDSFYRGVIEIDRFDSVPYEIALCRSCDFIWQRYILDDQGMRLLYEDWIPVDESFVKKSEGDVSLFFQYAKEMNAICHFFSRKPSELKVLDFGMGWGYWCRMATAFNYNVCGYDFSWRRREYAKKNGLNVLSSSEVLNGITFDFINCEQVLEHLPSPLAVLKMLRQALVQDGVIRLSVPDGGSVAKDLQSTDWVAAKDAIQPLEHVNAFNHETLIQLAGYAGLTWINEEIPLVWNHCTCLYFRNDAVREKVGRD